MTESDKEKPLFVYSMYNWITLGIFIFLFGILDLVLGLVTLPLASALEDPTVWLSLAIGSVLIHRMYYLQPRHGRFFQSTFVLTGRKLRKEYDYSQLRWVGLTRLWWSKTLTIDVAGDVFVLYKNPKSIVMNPDLRSDLYTWLKAKIPASQNRSGDGS